MVRIFSYALAAIIFLGFGASWIIEKAQSSHEIPSLKSVPNFSMINQHGVPFSQKNFEGKITVLDFMFTSCTGCLLYTSPSPRDRQKSRMPSSA